VNLDAPPLSFLGKPFKEMSKITDEQRLQIPLLRSMGMKLQKEVPAEQRNL
jgi:hypothetical protein